MTNYRKYLLLIKALEATYTKKVFSATYLYYSSFIDDLKLNGLDVAKNNLQNSFFSNELLEVLTSIYSKGGVKGARLTYNELRQSLKEGQKANGFGRNERWIREVLNYLKLNILQFASLISETVKDDILKIISKGVEEGWGIDQIVLALRNSPIPQARARVTARTEIVRAANVGHAAGAREFPFEVNKKWIAAKDHRTRHSHRSVNNHLVDENGYFDVPVYKGKTRIGTEQMLYPGDAKATKENTINCRCRIVHEPKLDEQGNPIRRSTTGAVVIPLRATPAQQLPSIGIAAIRKELAKAIVFDVEESE